MPDQRWTERVVIADDEYVVVRPYGGVAQTVGVSHQAPYVHFGNKRRFLAAVAGMGAAAGGQ
jgi:hypothetical protein